MGQRSLGSDQYFGRGSGDYDEDDYDDDDDDLDGLVNNLAEETRRDLRVVSYGVGLGLRSEVGNAYTTAHVGDRSVIQSLG